MFSFFRVSNLTHRSFGGKTACAQKTAQRALTLQALHTHPKSQNPCLTWDFQCNSIDIIELPFSNHVHKVREWKHEKMREQFPLWGIIKYVSMYAKLWDFLTRSPSYELAADL